MKVCAGHSRDWREELSTDMLNAMMQEQADQFDAVLHPDATAENAANSQPKLDRTHLNPHGQ